MVCVPTISRFFGISIAMFFDDHGPPHFHARYAQGSAKVRIDSLEVIESTLPRRQLAVRTGLGGAAPGRAARELASRPRW
jgi:hypothetical protein